MRKELFIFSLAVLLPLLLQSQKYSNEFLRFGTGAKALGMGSAQTAGVKDVTAGYWNPGALSNLQDDIQVGFMHAEWFAGIGKYDYLAVAAPLKKMGNDQAVGFSFIRFGIDDIPNTLELFEDDGTINYNNIENFSAADYALIFSYSRQAFLPGLHVGANAKIIRRSVGKFASAWGFGLDVGATYGLTDQIKLGATIRDITGTFNAWRFNFTQEELQTLQITGNELPEKSVEATAPSVTTGIQIGQDFGKFGGNLAADLTFFLDGQRNTLLNSSFASIDPAIGLEGHYNNAIFLRLGISQFQRTEDFDGSKSLIAQPSFGLGLKLYSINLDYAFTNFNNSTNQYSHIFSVVLDLDLDFIKRAVKQAN